jgi:serine/threonine protein phosphatase 1
LGNHEHIMRVLLKERVITLLQSWLYFGGRETLLSYGISASLIASGDHEALFDALEDKTPQAHKDFLNALPLSAEFGGYFFCHAGVRPGVELAAQTEQDLVWIRDEFLESQAAHGKMIVHGHSISSEVEFMPNRIGIDTGAYASGCLTALGLEGTKKWLIQTA